MVFYPFQNNQLNKNIVSYFKIILLNLVKKSTIIDLDSLKKAAPKMLFPSNPFTRNNPCPDPSIL
jgi:hypothetical protein